MAPAVQVRDLVKRYRNATANAVDGVSFDVAAGEFFTLLGPNGAGKTTTISILTTTLTPTSGSVLVAGHDAVRESSAVRSSAGIIFQRPSLDQNLTAEENVRFHAILYGLFPYRPAYALMPLEYKKRVADLAAVLGIEREIFQPVRTYSGGMKRKLEIVRSLIHRPAVLFLDEPTSGLDVASRRSLWEYLRGVRRESGTTVFLTTHYLEEAEDSDRVCIIDRGRVVSIGAPAQVKAELTEEYLLLEADDRSALRAELRAKSVPFVEGSPLRIDLSGRSAHALVKSIDTPLTTFRVHTPTLEDAYLLLVARGREEWDEGPRDEREARGAGRR